MEPESPSPSSNLSLSLFQRGQMFPKLLFQIAQVGARLKGNALDAIHPSLNALKAFLYGVEPFINRPRQ